MAKIILCNSDEAGFLLDCLSLMLGIAIRCIQRSQAMLERGVCELAHSFSLCKPISICLSVDALINPEHTKILSILLESTDVDLDHLQLEKFRHNKG